MLCILLCSCSVNRETLYEQEINQLKEQIQQLNIQIENLNKKLTDYNALIEEIKNITSEEKTEDIDTHNDLQITLNIEAEGIQNSLFLSDNEKIERLVELFFKAKAEDQNIQDDIDLNFFQSSNKSKQLNNFIKNLKVWKQVKIKKNDRILWDNVQITINNIDLKENTALVNVYEAYEYVLNDYSNGFSSTGIDYTITLKKEDNKWLISDIASNDESIVDYDENETVEEIVNKWLAH